MSKRLGRNSGNVPTITGQPESPLETSAPTGVSSVDKARSQAHALIAELIRSVSESLPVKPPVLTDAPPYETLGFLCRMLMGEMGKPSLAIASTLARINNDYPNSEIHDSITKLLDVHHRSQRNAELDVLLTEISNPSQPDPPREKQPKFLTDTLVTAADGAGYAELSQNLEALNRDFRREIATRLEPALNAHVRAMPHDTYEEKKTIAKWVNEELRRFDLAIKCPKTGNPSILLVGSGNHAEIGRFIVEHKTPEGKRVRPVHTPDLPHLGLMEANPRREALVEWRDKVGGQRGDAGRE